MGYSLVPFDCNSTDFALYFTGFEKAVFLLLYDYGIILTGILVASLFQGERFVFPDFFETWRGSPNIMLQIAKKQRICPAYSLTYVLNSL